ncbi:RsmB/NOP family class I SAM-dependent RNA methyltransferase [Desulfovermiculus halophilus]|uniref:RsmB/NOP family class I SAM-dependent RNA methyltransferase n=1 Tax=Desulfovermiculus halophilus TaxID=339722 RepID=UPI000A0762D0|nr:RsmB/NOP family class I SAM-dependent RNA methyltransferase [Desulfovermiculus halophilus]
MTAAGHAQQDSACTARRRRFRLTCLPHERPAVEALLAAEGYAFEAEPYLASARCLRTEPKPLGASAAAAFGLVYILDKSSMLPPVCLGARPGEAALDLCASPGSKTGVLAEMVGDNGLVAANEPKRKRYQTLRQNLQQLNLVQAATTGYPAEDYPGPGRWTRILLDVPCSGWGTADKNPKVMSLWTEQTIKPLLSLQRRLLTRAAALLAPGGRLIYSTCTTNVQENEDQVGWAAAKFGLHVRSLPAAPGFVFDPVENQKAKGALRVNGPASGGQSFFVAELGQGGESCPPPEASVSGSKHVRVAPDVLSRLKVEVNWQGLPPGRAEMEGERLVFRPDSGLDTLDGLSWQGTVLGQGRTGLRLSSRARRLVPEIGAGPSLVLDRVDELHRLLQGQSLPAPGPGPMAGLYWMDLPLGWVTVKGRRCMWTGR